MNGSFLYTMGTLLIILGITAIVPGNIYLKYWYRNAKNNGGKKK